MKSKQLWHGRIWPQDAESAHAVVGQIQRPHEAFRAANWSTWLMAVELFGCDLNILRLFRLNVVLGFKDFNTISSILSEHNHLRFVQNCFLIFAVRRSISILPQGFWKTLRCYTETSDVMIRNKCLELSFSPFDPRGTSCGSPDEHHRGVFTRWLWMLGDWQQSLMFDTRVILGRFHFLISLNHEHDIVVYKHIQDLVYKHT